ncbi:MAG: hypothetical protein LCH81_00970 [Bacteroidetes bacterium]|nr:hypothetical protein [Bacteroidota bacterium]
MKTFIKYVAGIILALSALFSITLGSVAAFLIFAIGAIITIPPALEMIEKGAGFRLESTHKFLGVIGSILFGSACLQNSVSPNKPIPRKEFVRKDDTIVVHDTVFKEPTPTKKKKAKKQAAAPAQYFNESAAKPTPQKSVSKSTKKGRSNPKTGRRYSSHTYYTGPRGGCYYINADGKKVYVDHSYCR